MKGDISVIPDVRTILMFEFEDGNEEVAILRVGRCDRQHLQNTRFCTIITCTMIVCRGLVEVGGNMSHVTYHAFCDDTHRT